MQTKQEPSVASLVNSAIADGQALVKQQIELAKAEVAYSAKNAGATAGMFAGAGVLAFLAFVFGLVAGAYGIVAAGLPEWAGFLIVAGTLLLIALILVLVGRAASKKVGPPQRAVAQAQATKSALATRGPAPEAAEPAITSGP